MLNRKYFLKSKKKIYASNGSKKRNAQSLCVYNTHQISEISFIYVVMYLNKASSFVTNIRTYIP
jgi:hypothetical protein